jgi:hypothetical protein
MRQPMRLERLIAAVGRHLLLALCWMLVPAPSPAHDVSATAVLLDIGARQVDIEMQLPLPELGAALSLPLDASPGAAIAQHGNVVAPYILQHVRVSTRSGKPYAIELASLRMSRFNDVNWLIAKLVAAAPAAESTDAFALDYDVIIAPVVTHNAIVSVRRDFRNALFGEKPLTVGMFAFQQTHLLVDGSDGSWLHGARSVFSLGIEHIAEGTDHLLFLLVLLLPAPMLAARGRWREVDTVSRSTWNIVKTVSGFTIGHSLTLAAGATGLVTLPSQPIEILIAVSILVSAVHALRPLMRGREFYLAGAFGLIHGLAFASSLQGFGYDATALALSLLSFNLGIETMQLIVVVATLPWLLLLSRSRFYAPVRIAGAIFGGAAAVGWIGERAWNFPNPIAPAVNFIAAHALLAVAVLAALSVGSLKNFSMFDTAQMINGRRA